MCALRIKIVFLIAAVIFISIPGALLASSLDFYIAQSGEGVQRFELPLPEFEPQDETELTEEQQTETEETQEVAAEQDTRLQLPDFESEEQTSGTEASQEEMDKDKLIEMIMADSEVMRLEFEEKIRRHEEKQQRILADSETLSAELELKSDSIAYYQNEVEPRLRRQIQRLRIEVASLRAQLAGDTEFVADTLPLQPDTVVVEKPEEQEEDEATAPARLLDPNTASLDDLKAIPALSARLAGRIKWYREDIRRFNNRSDLRRVPGVDSSVYNQIENYFRPGSYD